MNILWNRLRYVLSPQFDVYEQVAKHVHGKIADIGFGTGFGTHLLANSGNAVCAYEIDVEALEFAKRAFPSDKVIYKHGDIVKGIEERGFDFVIMIDVIEHIGNDLKALRNVSKMLKNDGCFICSTPNRLSRYRKSDTHVREYSPTELFESLNQVFSSVDIRNYKLEIDDSMYINPIMGYAKGGKNG